jgi:hypothetical protein
VKQLNTTRVRSGGAPKTIKPDSAPMPKYAPNYTDLPKAEFVLRQTRSVGYNIPYFGAFYSFAIFYLIIKVTNAISNGNYGSSTIICLCILAVIVFSSYFGKKENVLINLQIENGILHLDYASTFGQHYDKAIVIGKDLSSLGFVSLSTSTEGEYYLALAIRRFDTEANNTNPQFYDIFKQPTIKAVLGTFVLYVQQLFLLGYHNHESRYVLSEYFTGDFKPLVDYFHQHAPELLEHLVVAEHEQ